MATTTYINKSNLMKRAWAIYHTCRYDHERKSIALRFIKERFANALCTAWAEANATAESVGAQIAELKRQIDFLSTSLNIHSGKSR